MCRVLSTFGGEGVTDDKPAILIKPFASLSQPERETVILNALVRNPHSPFEEIAKQYKFTPDEYLDTLTSSPTFGHDIVEHCIMTIITPALPSVMKTLATRAIDGDTSMMKMYLQMVQALRPDETNVNIYANVSDTELKIQLQQAMEELDNL